MPYAPGVEPRADQIIMQGNAQGQQTTMAIAGWLSNYLQQQKQVNAAGKAADTIFQAMPEDQRMQMGLPHPEEWKGRSAKDKAAAMQGVVQLQTMQEVQARFKDYLAQAAMRQQQADEDAAVGQAVKSYATPPEGIDPTADTPDQAMKRAMSTPGLGGRNLPRVLDSITKYQQMMTKTGTAGAEDSPPEQVLIDSVPYVWKKGSREFQPRADFVPNLRSQAQQDAADRKAAGQPAPDEEGPKTSKDGKFYWDTHFGAWKPISGAAGGGGKFDALLEKLGVGAEGGTAPAAPDAGKAAPADELVPVINPGGKRVKIKSSQLKAALASGYKQP